MGTLFTVARRSEQIATEPGSIVICHHCTGVNWTDERRALVKLDDALRAQFSAVDLAAIDLAAEHMRTLKRRRGEAADDPRVKVSK